MKAKFLAAVAAVATILAATVVRPNRLRDSGDFLLILLDWSHQQYGETYQEKTGEL